MKNEHVPEMRSKMRIVRMASLTETLTAQHEFVLEEYPDDPIHDMIHKFMAIAKNTLEAIEHKRISFWDYQWSFYKLTQVVVIITEGLFLLDREKEEE